MVKDYGHADLSKCLYRAGPLAGGHCRLWLETNLLQNNSFLDVHEDALVDRKMLYGEVRLSLVIAQNKSFVTT